MGRILMGFLLTFLTLPALAEEHKPVAQCQTKFTVVQQDSLKNITQGLPKKQAEWFKKEIEKKYPDVCYVGPSANVPLVFFITVTAAVYHGTRVETTQSDSDTRISGDIDATATTTTKTDTEVPYDVDYGVYTLTVETREGQGKWKVRHRFQQKGLYRQILLRVPLGPQKGYHPVRTVIEEAAKWLHEGGLTNPLETVAPQ